MQSFELEQELVEYALDYFKENEWEKAHITAMTFDFKEILEAEKKLHNLKIDFKRNDIPNYHLGITAYRIFVFGTDILKLNQFIKKYLHLLYWSVS